VVSWVKNNEIFFECLNTELKETFIYLYHSRQKRTFWEFF